MKRLLTSLGAALALCAVPVLHASDGRNHPPIPMVQTQPVYPLSLRDANVQGEVVVEFIVNTEGNVAKVGVVRTTNPGFINAAIASVVRWKFVPGEKDGRPVNTSMVVPILFRITEGDAAATPGALFFPLYPTVDLASGKTGSASVQVDVTADGKVSGLRLLSASAPEFGYALMAAAQASSYIPARHRGECVAAHLVIHRDFCIVPTPTPDQVCPNGLERAFALRSAQHPTTLCSEKDLDQPLTVEFYVAPKCPLSLLGRHGSAKVSFDVDEKGAPRLLEVVSSTDPAFGYAVIQAIAGWHFLAPVRHGKPTAVSSRITFAFSADGKVAPTK